VFASAKRVLARLRAERPLFTVLLPIVRPPHFLPHAIRSVQTQKVRAFELFVVCDGAPEATIAAARAFAADDPRIRVFPFAKGKRHGEAHRHQVLKRARGHYVAHIGDDDVWLPNHLTELAKLLAEVDFGNLPAVRIGPTGKVTIPPGDLAKAEDRQRMLSESWNFFGPTFCGYRLDAYRRLPEGWAPAPEDLWTDLHMWRKFLATPGLRFGTRRKVTAIQFPTSARGHWSPAEREAEIQAWLSRLQDPAERAALQKLAMRS
jgi:glycosyltransferase involved in cell wall biosynthesis